MDSVAEDSVKKVTVIAPTVQTKIAVLPIYFLLCPTPLS
jgi:hypothetical protein